MKRIAVSLRVKFSIVIIIFGVVLLLYNFIVTGYSIISRNQSFTAQVLLQDTVRLLDYFSSTVNDGLVLDDDILLINTFDKIKSMGNLDYAVLFDREDGVRFHSETFSSQEFDKNDPVFVSLKSQTNMTVYPKFDSKKIQGAYIISRSFYDARGKYYGMLWVKYSTATLSLLVGQIRSVLVSNMSWVLASGVLLSVIFGLLLAALTLSPIKRLVRGTEIIGNGDLDYVLPVGRNDELGVLSDSFNRMTKRIREEQKILIEQKKLEEQMVVAKSIQESIYPDQPLVEPGYEIASFTVSARMIGGDYHYFGKIDDRFSYFVVADVSGKGIPAALFTFMLSTVINTVVRNGRSSDSGDILTESNRILMPEFSKVERFATVMLGCYDAEKRTVNFVSAGHGDLYIYKKNAGTFVESRNILVPIGMDSDAVYRSAEFSVEKGDIIVVLTDGITDARNTEMKSYGMKRILAHPAFLKDSPAEEILNEVRDDVFRYVNGEELFDDMTMLILKQKA